MAASGSVWSVDAGFWRLAAAVGGSGLDVVSAWVCGIISVYLWGAGGPPVLFLTRPVKTVSGCSNQQWRIFGGLCFSFSLLGVLSFFKVICWAFSDFI